MGKSLGGIAHTASSDDFFMDILLTSEKELTFSKSDFGARNVSFARLVKIYANYRAEKSHYNLHIFSSALFDFEEAQISGDSFGVCMDTSDQTVYLPVPPKN